MEHPGFSQRRLVLADAGGDDQFGVRVPPISSDAAVLCRVDGCRRSAGRGTRGPHTPATADPEQPIWCEPCRAASGCRGQDRPRTGRQAGSVRATERKHELMSRLWLPPTSRRRRRTSGSRMPRGSPSRCSAVRAWCRSSRRVTAAPDARIQQHAADAGYDGFRAGFVARTGPTRDRHRDRRRSVCCLRRVGGIGVLSGDRLGESVGRPAESRRNVHA